MLNQKNKMYKSSHKPRPKGLLLWLTLAAIVVLLSFTALGLLELNGKIDFYNNKPITTDQAQQTQISEVPSANPTNTVVYEQDKPTGETTLPEKNPNPVTVAPTNADLSITITRINQASKTLQIRGIISGTESGTCTAVLTRSNLFVSSSSAVTQQANQFGCGTLDIPISDFKEAGVWSLVLTLKDTAGSTVKTTQDTPPIVL